MIAHYSSTYADHPTSSVQYWDAYLHFNWSPDNYRKGIDYNKTSGSQLEENSKWHSMMSDAEAAAGMTEDVALARGLSFGWENIFASNGGKDLSKLGQGIHALQDAMAHDGVKTNDHLGKNLSSAGKMFKDMYGSTSKASNLTKSALMVVKLLNGERLSLRVGDRLDLRGMNENQIKEVQGLLREQGYSTSRTDKQ